MQSHIFFFSLSFLLLASVSHAQTRTPPQYDHVTPPRIEVIHVPVPVYETSECRGVIVNGRCSVHDADLDPLRLRCYGEWLPDGSCTGPVF